jgi:hypothetical protein
MLGQHLGQPSDQPPRRLVAGAGDDGRVGEDLLAREAATLAVLVVELRVEEAGHQIVGWVFGTPFDVLGEHVPAGDLLLLHLHRLSGLGAEVGVGLVAHRDLVLLGDAEQHADDAHRHDRAELGHDVEALGSDERVEAPNAEPSDLVLERGHSTRREDP